MSSGCCLILVSFLRNFPNLLVRRLHNPFMSARHRHRRRRIQSVTPLTDHELAVVFPLAAARLAMNATTWTQRLTQGANDHGERRMKHTWPALAKVARIDPDFAEATLRHTCGLSAHPDAVLLEKPLGPGPHLAVVETRRTRHCRNRHHAK
jgi:hypothetical protein